MINSNFGWLKNLKIGDEVVVDKSSTWYKDYFVIEIVKIITPTGRIKLSDGTQYQPDGRKIGDTNSFPLRQVTPEILDLIERRKLISKLNFDEFKGLLTAERLKTLLEWQSELTGK